MKKKKFLPDGNRLQDLHIKEQNSLMATRLHFAKPTINIKCPESFDCFNKKFKKPKEKGTISKYT